ncbi:MAG TPA: shikimate dehydrogenase [Pyrinomonadaceae bacterium]|nr:shikimate dehydrogenase [Pyrinomonadaceae bacterium]
MNKGKICVSVCAKTAEELFQHLESATSLADLVELRFDCLDDEYIHPVRERLWEQGGLNRYISTFRSFEQGGTRRLTFSQRKNFWNSGYETEIADVEEDLVEDTFSWVWPHRICSYHDFDGVPVELEKIFHRLRLTDAEIIKIAAKVEDATKAIPIFNLIKIAKTRHKQVIPIAMGEAGKWTRILGLAHGAYLTYASLKSGGETAPGQISADDLINVFRVKELGEATEVYGIIAGNTGYTMSPYIHNAAFKSTRLDAVFVPLQVTNLDEFIRRMVAHETRELELNFHGFSVTNPHKQAIIKYLDQIDETARAIGAVNTVNIVDDKLVGYNTDAFGFIQPLIKRFGDLKDARAAVVGAGGAARACVSSLVDTGAEVTVFSRDITKAQTLAKEFNSSAQKLEAGNSELETDFSTFDIVVNATPIGTRGERENNTIAAARHLQNVKLVYDLVYNPAETRLLRESRLAGTDTLNGFEMLIAQATKQFEIWTGKPAPIDEMVTAARKRLDEC